VRGLGCASPKEARTALAVTLSAPVDHEVSVSFHTSDDTAVGAGAHPDFSAGPELTVHIPAFTTGPVALPIGSGGGRESFCLTAGRRST